MSVDAGEDTIVSYEYNEYNGKLKKLTYASGFVVEYVYNDLELLEEIWYTNSGVRELAYEYEYTDDGQVHEFIDNLSGKNTVYKYDTTGKLLSFTEYGNDDSYFDLSAQLSYNSSEWLDNIRYYLNHPTTSASAYNWAYSYKYFTDGLIEYVNLDTADADGTETYYYDEYDRVYAKDYIYRVTGNSSERFVNNVEYSYEEYEGYTSNRVETYTSTVNGTSVSSTFTYDANGNITKIVYSTGEEVRYVVRYVYDYLDRLIREDNGLKGYTYVYTYDKAGNITKKQTVSLTAEEVIDEDSGNIVTYTYATDGWGDRLTAYNGHEITYDEIGNPLSYYNGASYTFTWSGRELTVAGKGGNTYSFTYNDAGTRTTKTKNGVTTTYYLNGTQILAEETSGNVTVYLYDSESAPLGMQYRGANYAANTWDVYWYEKNIFGDIVAVYDETGTKLISYEYDAYGRCWSMQHNGGYSTAAYNNPFRYRGYYYDRDLELYYLNSRYYDGYTGRFISPDKFVSTGQGLTGYNMYAYCGDNPVMRVDPTGKFWKELWNAFTQKLQHSSGYFVAAAVVSQADTIAPGPADLVSATLIICGVLLCATTASYDTITAPHSSIFDSKDEGKSEVIPDTPPSIGATYYHVTTPENAAAIIASGVMKGGEWEGGHVYAWKTKPSKYAIKNSGAHTGVIIVFKTNAPFVPDMGITNPRVQVYGPVKSLSSGPIVVWDVQIVGG